MEIPADLFSRSAVSQADHETLEVAMRKHQRYYLNGDRHRQTGSALRNFVILLLLVAGVWFLGTTYVGWNLDPRDEPTPDQTVRLTVDGKRLTVLGFIDNGVTMVPLREIFEAAGARVAYRPETGVSYISGPGRDAVLYSKNSRAVVDGNPYTLQRPPVVKDGRTFVPLELVRECLPVQVGVTVELDFQPKESEQVKR